MMKKNIKHDNNANTKDDRYCVLCKGNQAELLKFEDKYIHIYCALYSTNVIIDPSLILCNNNNDNISKLAILNWDANRILHNETLLPKCFKDIKKTINSSITTKCC